MVHQKVTQKGKFREVIGGNVKSGLEDHHDFVGHDYAIVMRPIITMTKIKYFYERNGYRLESDDCPT